MKLRNVNDRWFMKTLVKGNDGIFKHFFLLTVFYHIFCTFVCHVFTGPHRERKKKKKKKSYESRFCTSQQNNNTNGRKMRIGKCPWYQAGDNWIPQLFLLHPVTKLRIINWFIKTLVKRIYGIKHFFSVISVLSLLLYERAEEEKEEELWGQILHIIAKQ